VLWESLFLCLCEGQSLRGVGDSGQQGGGFILERDRCLSAEHTGFSTEADRGEGDSGEEGIIDGSDGKPFKSNLWPKSISWVGLSYEPWVTLKINPIDGRESVEGKGIS